MKKLFLATTISIILAGCATKKSEPKEYYKISNANVIEYITEANNIEKCLPDGIKRKSLDDEERAVLSDLKYDALINIIGSWDAYKIWGFYLGDHDGAKYFNNKREELAHNRTNVTKSECSVMKKNLIKI